MDNTAQRRQSHQRDFRRELRQFRRQRQSERLQQRYQFKGIMGAFSLMLLCLAAALALWFTFNLLMHGLDYISNINLKAID